MSRSIKDCWPTPEQELLLQAALLKGQDAVNAWEQWAAIVDFDKIDFGSQRLLPLLYHNLLDQGVQNSLMARYKGVYRRFWMSNHFLNNRTRPVLAALHEAGIEMLLFKGAGFVLSTGLNLALRPMDDIDFLVRKEVAQTAINVIRELGWQPKVEGVGDFNPITHAVMYHDGKGHCIDLHWHSLTHDMTGKHEIGYWERSFNGIFDAIPVKIMGITDQLIHTVVHGIRWNPIPSIRWIADAFLLLENSKNPIQWDHLIDQAGKLRVSLPVFQGLRYQKNKYDVSVPDYVLDSLERFPVSPLENLYYQLSTKKPLPVFGFFILRIFRYLTYLREHYPFPGFLRYLKQSWNIDYLWQIPLEGVLRMWRKVKIDLFNQDPYGR